MRDLFVTLLVFCEVRNTSELWERHWTNLADDIEYNQQKMTNIHDLKISSLDKQMMALAAINNLLKQYGKKVADYPGLPELQIGFNTKYKTNCYWRR